MEEVLYYTMLYDTYGELLTDKQQNYFQEYYFNNLSLAEIAENNQVSRNAVHKQIKEALHKLDHYEQVLQLVEKNRQLEQLVTLIEDKKLQEKFKSIIEQ